MEALIYFFPADGGKKAHQNGKADLFFSPPMAGRKPVKMETLIYFFPPAVGRRPIKMEKLIYFSPRRWRGENPSKWKR